MQHHLLNQFQGIAIGATLGWKLGDRSVTDISRSTSTRSPQGGDRNLWETPNCVEVATAYLIDTGRIEPTGFAQIVADLPPQMPATDRFDAWIATLLVAMFCHEDATALSPNLRQAIAALQLPLDYADGVLAIGYAIARILNANCPPHKLLPQTLSYLQALAAHPLLVQQLTTIQTLLEEGAGLEGLRRLSSEASRHPQSAIAQFFASIAGAIYCVLDTPDDVRLSVLRSMRLRSHPKLAAVMAGALAGAYNGAVGLPVDWCMALGSTQEAQIQRIATQLWAAWSGVYDVRQLPQNLPLVTAPGVLRTLRSA
jgi:ADP-ribosylglycohydrolase